MIKIRRFNESVLTDIIKGDYYVKLKFDRNHSELSLIMDSYKFEPISEEESDHYLPFIRRYVDILSGMKEGKKYYFEEKHLDVITWDRLSNKKVPRWVYVFRKTYDTVPAFAFCYLYKLPDDYIIIQFWIIGANKNETYIFDLHEGIDKFKLDKKFNKTKVKKTNESTLSPSFLLDGELYKEVTGQIYDITSKEGVNLYEMEKIRRFIKKFIDRIDSSIINYRLEDGNSLIYFELENGNIKLQKLYDDYFYLSIDIPIVIKGFEKYCDHRTQSRYFLIDSTDGLDKFANDDPLKIFYPHIYHSLK